MENPTSFQETSHDMVFLLMGYHQPVSPPIIGVAIPISATISANIVLFTSFCLIFYYKLVSLVFFSSSV